jgi:cellulose synthase/poly-beta-1,6-N-acetylglucosamine synthase-like glycosyltransferase
MVVLHFLSWALLVAEVCIAFPVAYLCILSCSALISASRKSHIDIDKETLPQNNFALLIPAYNEEIILGTLLESLSHLDYPKELYTIYVIADNCTDTTAELARRVEGVCVYERFDRKKRGKGYALNWMLQQIEEKQHDAYVMLDADSVVESTFLRVMNSELARGAKVLQARYTVLNATESPSSALRWVALTLMNHVRPLGRNGIGGSSTLTGNGMCFSRDILTRYPWQAFGIAEDYQYYLTLIQQGERVHYVPEAIVRAQMPITFAQMRTQDVRWEALDPHESQWRTAWQLLRGGLRVRSFIQIEAMMELLTPPLSIIVASCLFVLAGSLLLWSLPQIVFGLLLIGGIVCYIATALYLLRAPRAVYKALLYVPWFVFWKLWVYLVLSRSSKHNQEWVRTARTSS